jgi:hypothetical protein
MYHLRSNQQPTLVLKVLLLVLAFFRIVAVIVCPRFVFQGIPCDDFG